MNKHAWEIRRTYPKRTLELAKETNDLAQKHLLEASLAYSYRNSGTAYYLLSKYEAGLNDLNEAKALFKAQGNLHALATTIRTIGNIWHSIDDYEKSISCYENALAITQKLDDKQGTAYNYGNLGYVYKKLGAFDKALENMSQTLGILIELQDDLGLADVQANMGDVYLQKGDDAMAFELFSNSLDHASRIYHLRGMANANMNLGNYYFKKEDFKEAIKYHTLALDAANEMGEESLRASVCKNFADACEASGDFKRALELHREYEQLNTAALRRLNDQNMSKMRAQFALDYAESESQRYKEQNAQLERAKAEMERLSIVASKTSNGVVILSPDNKTEWLNEAYAHITGYSLDDLLDKSPGDILIGDHTQEETLLRIRQKANDLLPWKEEILVYHKEGHELWLEVSSTPVLDDSGTLIKHVEIINDVTQKVLNEKALERLSLVASETENVILILDAEGNLEWVNDSFERLNNLTMKELIAERGKNIRTISNNDKMGEILDACSTSKKPIKYDSLNITNEGTRVWESSTLTPIFNNEGHLTNFIIIDADITQLKNAQAEIENKNAELERLSIVAQKMNEAVVITDADGKIEYYNEGLVRNSGFGANEFAEFMSKHTHLHMITSRTDIPEVIAGFRSNPEPFFYDSPHDRKDGTQMWTTASLSPVYSDSGELSKIIVVYTDINERKLFVDQLSEKNREILDSINYAKRLQEAILPSEEFIADCFDDAFIFYKPKAIVAGDFYWMQKAENTILFAAADCTGHGVPGAMVSVVCHNALNRAVREHKLLQPSLILDKTKDIVIEQFTRNNNEVSDGMDIALCTLTGNILQYSGANNPLWIIRNDEILEFTASKQPIGKYTVQHPFDNHKIELRKGDQIYIFSDGFADQFGGTKGKKFKRSNLKKLLLNICGKSMLEQKVHLKNAFEDWRGDLEQIDDVCIMGVRV